MASRLVHCADGVAWLKANPLPASHAIVTSLPDSSELPGLGFDGWRRWFQDVAALCCRQVADDAVAIFFQTDVKRDGRWVDKGYLVSAGAEAAGSHCLWHKVVCRAPAGVTTFGRPAYAHLVCFSRGLRLEKAQSSADVLPRLGEMPWARAMGVEACEAVAKFLLAHTKCRTVVDPFCGVGTMLAVANRHGLDAVGVELSAKRAEKARRLEVHPSVGG
ncbi:MAG: SAM-dependent methyltransferase [Myxococcota bacterium]